jgi:hypothetical protein
MCSNNGPNRPKDGPSTADKREERRAGARQRNAQRPERAACCLAGDLYGDARRARMRGPQPQVDREPHIQGPWYRPVTRAPTPADTSALNALPHCPRVAHVLGCRLACSRTAGLVVGPRAETAGKASTHWSHARGRRLKAACKWVSKAPIVQLDRRGGTSSTAREAAYLNPRAHTLLAGRGLLLRGASLALLHPRHRRRRRRWALHRVHAL